MITTEVPYLAPKSEGPEQRNEPRMSRIQWIQAGVSFTIFSTALGFYLSDFNNCRKDLVSRSIIEVVGGGTFGFFLSAVLPYRAQKEWKSFVSDYASPIFLILSQVYDNLTKEAQKEIMEGFFGFLNVQGGLVFAVYLHSVVRRGRGKGSETPLLDTPALGNQKYSPFVDTLSKRSVQSLSYGFVGAMATLIGTFSSQAALLQDYGLIVTGYATARLFSELWFQKTLSMRKRGSNSCMVSQYARINRNFIALFHALPGAFIVLSEIADKNQLVAVSKTLFVFTGVIMGWNSHMRQLRFSEMPKARLLEIQKRKEGVFPSTTWSKVKWLIGFPGILTFAGLTVAGYNPIDNAFASVSPFVISSMTAFAVSLYGSYFFSEWARIQLANESESRLVHSVYYFTHYAPGVPLLFLYIMEKLLINDEAIDLDSPLAGVVTTVAYGSLGMGLGTEASGRYSFASPRLPSSLYFALFGRYFTNLVTGKLDG